MKKRFEWYFQPTKSELDEIWKTGILTVDTNVLLDLYRYHKSTRDSLLTSLQKFEGKKWISNQAAQEFIKNRTKVIVSTGKTFQQAHDETGKLSTRLASTVAQLKGNRIISNDVVDQLHSIVEDAIKKAQGAISSAKSDYPDFFQEDSILDQLSNIFGGSVGEGFKEPELSDIKATAEKRKQEQIPPGYLDKEKDGDQPYGDYYLWRQIIDYAKETQKPIILVTSERKEDWWEMISGRTTGPRPELLREAKELSGQRVLIYQTERFLKFALQRLKEPVNDVAIEEIRAISTLRFPPEPTVKILEQETVENTLSRNTGVITLELLRPIKSFTVSGHFEPRMSAVPLLIARPIRAPAGHPPFRIGVGTGTNHDFNIHASAQDGTLPIGEYAFEYDANCLAPDFQLDADTPGQVSERQPLSWPTVPKAKEPFGRGWGTDNESGAR